MFYSIYHFLGGNLPRTVVLEGMIHFPDDPCMVYLKKYLYLYPINDPNVGKYTINIHVQTLNDPKWSIYIIMIQLYQWSIFPINIPAPWIIFEKVASARFALAPGLSMLAMLALGQVAWLKQSADVCPGKPWENHWKTMESLGKSYETDRHGRDGVIFIAASFDWFGGIVGILWNEVWDSMRVWLGVGLNGMRTMSYTVRHIEVQLYQTLIPLDWVRF